MGYWLEQLLNGLGLVGPVVLIAISLSLLLSSVSVFNVAVGSTYVLAALAGIYGANHGGLATMILYAVGTAVAFGVLLELAILGPQRRRNKDSELASFAATLGVTLIVSAVVLDQTGAQAVTLPPTFMRADKIVTIGSLHLQVLPLSIFAIAALLTIGLTLFLQRTRSGKLYRAVASDGELAESIGVGINRVAIHSWVFAGLLLGAATVLILLGSRSVSAHSGDAYLLLPFAAVIAGGMGNLRGTFIAALSFGVATSLLSSVIAKPGLVNALVFSALLLLLIIRPAGIVPLADAERGY